MKRTILQVLAMVLMVAVCGAQKVYVREIPAKNALLSRLRALMRDFGPSEAGFELETAESSECVVGVMKFMERSFRVDVPDDKKLVFRAQCVVYFRDVGDKGKVNCSVGYGFDAYEEGARDTYLPGCFDFPPIVLEPEYDKLLIDAQVDWTVGLYVTSKNFLIQRDRTRSSTPSATLGSPSVSQSIQGTLSGSVTDRISQSVTGRTAAGVTVEAGDDEQGGLVGVWKLKIGGAIYWSSPAVSSGVVFVGSEDSYLKFGVNVLCDARIHFCSAMGQPSNPMASYHRPIQPYHRSLQPHCHHTPSNHTASKSAMPSDSCFPLASKSPRDINGSYAIRRVYWSSHVLLTE